MNYKQFSLAALAGTLLATPAQAQDKAPKPVSPFILCDGRTGHVGLMETLGRLVAITVTAGLSEAATATDDDARKLKGVEAAGACDTALATEHDNGRRVQLAYAKAVHLIEADRLDDALAAARAVDAAGGPLAEDWGYRRTSAPRILILQADILTRMKKPADAQAVAVQATQLAPYDVNIAQLANQYINLTPDMDEAKNAALAQMSRLLPRLTWSRISAEITAGRLNDALADLEALRDLGTGFSPDNFHPDAIDATRAALLVLAGNGVQSDEIATRVQASLTQLAASGYAAQNGTFVAEATEALSLRQILRDATSGKAKDARTVFRAHGPWLLVNKALLIAAVGKLRDGATPDELTGTLAESPAAMLARTQAEHVAALSDAKRVKTLYAQIFFAANTEAFAKAGNATWKVGEKPRFLVKRKADDTTPGDILSTEPHVIGLVAGEALCLQAALIAKARGAQGYVMSPVRKYVTIAVLRWGNGGEAGMPARLMLDADKVIADLSPHIPQPTPAR
jgi:hypothetical protein